MNRFRWVLIPLAAALPQISLAQRCPEQKLAKPNGNGVTVSQYCDRREGEFRDGVLHGKGKISYPSRGQVEEGNFLRGRLWGQGRITYEDGRVAEGEFVEGNLSGEGKLSWADGRLHEGIFYNGRPAGAGRARSASGEILEGKFDSQGKLIGAGVKTLPDGSRLYGEFRESQPAGLMTLVRPDGTNEKQQFAFNGRSLQPRSAANASAGAAAAGGATPSTRADSQPQQQPGSPSSIGAAPAQVIQEVDRTVRGLRSIFGK